MFLQYNYCGANFRLPIWLFAKLIFSCWLVLPHFNGAAVVYRNYIRPFYMNPQIPIPQGSQIWYFPQKKSLFNQPDDVLSAAERYMEEHGTEAFERLISKVHTYYPMLLVKNIWFCFKVKIFLNLGKYDFETIQLANIMHRI